MRAAEERFRFAFGNGGESQEREGPSGEPTLDSSRPFQVRHHEGRRLIPGSKDDASSYREKRAALPRLVGMVKKRITRGCLSGAERSLVVYAIKLCIA